MQPHTTAQGLSLKTTSNKDLQLPQFQAQDSLLHPKIRPAPRADPWEYSARRLVGGWLGPLPTMPVSTGKEEAKCCVMRTKGKATELAGNKILQQANF